jgi:fatty acyl-CoA reductase
MNLEKLRMAMNKEENNIGGYCFDFDPKYIDWDDYFYRIHIPGVVKHMRD